MSRSLLSSGNPVAGLSKLKIDNLHHHIGGVIIDRLPAFLYLLAQDYTLQYANGYFHRQFGSSDASTPCYAAMRGRTSPCKDCPAQTVFKEQNEQVWIWRDKLRGQLYEVHDYPYPIEKDKILVLGLGINISGQRKSRKIQETVESCHDVLHICSHCKNITEEKNKGEWKPVETYLEKHNGVQCSQGICPECLVKYYPNAAKKILR
ncbi:hypothetical protein FCL47_05045 [Desulfopila sp. IMCC35006]|uniref:hypothetical protein n=1 Tax=Desulfopila sp. IMCC35006 TaxID=2569542 RepID=UPI0010AD74B6|nr:hypothetical protein [Desulfopila sp. IMCC35006]TKB27505.1 hypothetical protein FCL47_05045 [Desulfopila sp. IMCC35006]